MCLYSVGPVWIVQRYPRRAGPAAASSALRMSEEEVVEEVAAVPEPVAPEANSQWVTVLVLVYLCVRNYIVADGLQVLGWFLCIGQLNGVHVPGERVFNLCCRVFRRIVVVWCLISKRGTLYSRVRRRLRVLVSLCYREAFRIWYWRIVVLHCHEPNLA